jgi:hypothetical protein
VESIALTLPMYQRNERLISSQSPSNDNESVATSAVLQAEIEQRRALQRALSRAQAELEFWRSRSTEEEKQEALVVCANEKDTGLNDADPALNMEIDDEDEILNPFLDRTSYE